MVTMAPPPDAQRLTCPNCHRYLGTVEGCYAEYPPCACGVQTTVRVTGKRARREIEMAGERVEVKRGC